MFKYFTALMSLIVILITIKSIYKDYFMTQKESPMDRLINGKINVYILTYLRDGTIDMDWNMGTSEEQAKKLMLEKNHNNIEIIDSEKIVFAEYVKKENIPECDLIGALFTMSLEIDIMERLKKLPPNISKKQLLKSALALIDD